MCSNKIGVKGLGFVLFDNFIHYHLITNNMSTTVKLESSDGMTFEVPKEVAMMSVTLRHLIEDMEAAANTVPQYLTNETKNEEKNNTGS